MEKRPLFLAKLRAEVTRHVRLAERAGVTPVLRLNGTSDVPFEDLAPDLFADHPNLQAMDYTKTLRRYRAFIMAGRTMAGRPWPDNLHLCYSRSELTPDETVRDILDLGGTVAVVFRHKLPATWLGHGVNDATKNDWRWRDVPGQIQGLVALGPAERDDSGFVVDAD